MIFDAATAIARKTSRPVLKPDQHTASPTDVAQKATPR